MKKETVIFQMEKKLKDELKKEARDKGLSLSSYIRTILIKREK